MFSGSLKTIAGSFLLVIAIALVILASADLTPRENGFLGVLLAMFSTLVGAVVTHIYAESSRKAAISELDESHQRSLRTYALKAAEKVNNLSKELGRLAAYLEEELQEDDYTSIQEELNAKEERIYSAIHLVTTLKSVNDTALSDWQGVIGHELDEQRDKVEEREELLRDVAERLATLELARQASVHSTTAEEARQIRTQLESLRKDLSLLAGSLGAPLLTARRLTKSSRTKVEAICPQCEKPNEYQQKPRPHSVKGITCPHCLTELMSTYQEGRGFELRVRKELQEMVECPQCSTVNTILLDEWPSSTVTLPCKSCSVQIRVSRTTSGMKITTMPNPEPKYRLTEEIIAAVKTALPVQPWPKAVHRTIAEQLHFPAQLVQKAIQQLIIRGDFQDQLHGQICTTEEKIRIIRESGRDL